MHVHDPQTYEVHVRDCNGRFSPTALEGDQAEVFPPRLGHDGALLPFWQTDVAVCGPRPSARFNNHVRAHANAVLSSR